MVKLQRGFIVVTAVFSMLACLFAVLSVATNNWLNARAVLTTSLESEINYGLFAGELERLQLAAKLPFQLKVVCDFNLGACMYSCQRDATLRKDELERVLTGAKLEPCEQNQLRWTNANWDSDKILPTKALNETNINAATACIPAAWWLCTVLCLSFAIAFAFCSFAFAMLNLYTSPVEQICNIFGLYIWNSCTTCFALLALILWTTLFQQQLRQNVAVTDTLRAELTFSSAERASMGYSCYMLLATLFLSILNIGILWLRRYRLQHTAAPKRITIEQSDVPLQFY